VKVGRFRYQNGEDTPLAAVLPQPEGAVRSEVARTVSPRENCGNCDIKNLSKGSIVFLPVFVSGAGLVVGDMHFSQGDGCN